MLQLIKFISVGLINTGITITSYSILILTGGDYLISNIIGYCLGTLNSYLWNKLWVFKSKEKHSKLITKFICVNLLTLLINNSILFILVDKLQVNKHIAQLLATGLGMFINFGLNKIWTFKGEK